VEKKIKTRQEIYDVILIGSGPSAVAALSSLTSKLKVLVVDNSVRPPRKVEALKNQIGRKMLKGQNVAEIVNTLFENQKHILKSDFTKKKYWGSEYIYGEIHKNSPNYSQAYGGFSKIWGATCFPYANTDLLRMTKQFRSEISDHISKIEKLIDVEHSGTKSNVYPGASTENIKERSKLIGKFIDNAKLKTIKGLNFETSRLAISTKNQDKNKTQPTGCLNCGLCQVGCPVNFVWDSTRDFEIYMNSLKAELVVGNLIKFKELSDCVSITVKNSNNEEVYLTKKLLLTGGAKATSELLVSNNVYEKIQIFDSQTNLVCIWSRKKIDLEPTQFSFTDFSVHFENSNFKTHIQLYRLNDYFIHRIRENYLVFKLLTNKCFEYLSSHIIFGFAYLPQEISGQFIYSNGSWEKHKSADHKVIRKTLNRTSLKLFKLGLLMLPWQIKLPTGFGNHIGGQFYLDKSWKTLNSNLNWIKIDDFGRPPKLKRVHICDNLVFGPIPVGSVTLTSMANTSRIVSKIMKSAT